MFLLIILTDCPIKTTISLKTITNYYIIWIDEIKKINGKTNEHIKRLEGDKRVRLPVKC